MDKKILIVEDDPRMSKMVSFLFMSKGVNVKVARNGFEALGHLEEESADSIIMDIIMPEMDGFELCSKLKEHSSLKEIPVIVLSGLVSSGDKEKMISLGAADYITKPFLPSDLVQRVFSIMELDQ